MHAYNYDELELNVCCVYNLLVLIIINNNKVDIKIITCVLYFLSPAEIQLTLIIIIITTTIITIITTTIITSHFIVLLQTIAHRGHRAVSDSALVMQDTSKSSHRDRSAQTVETKIIANSRLAVSCIGKGTIHNRISFKTYWGEYCLLQACTLRKCGMLYNLVQLYHSDIMVARCSYRLKCMYVEWMYM